MELTAKFAAGAVALAAAGALVAAPLVSGLTAATESPDVMLTADGKGFLDPLFNLTDNRDVTNFLHEADAALDKVGLADLAQSQYYTLVPSGFLADDHSALVSGDGGAVASSSGTWVSNLLDSMGQLDNSSALANLNDVAGLLPNGVNYLFDQLAVDAIDLSHALGDPTATSDLDNVVNPNAFFGMLNDDAVSGLAGDHSFLGDVGATVVDVFGII